MALRNILAPRQQVQTASGVPIKGGSVFLREPGSSSVFISTFQDSALTVPHTNPIKLSGSGRANIWISRDCDLRIEDKNGNLILEELNANPDALGVSAQGGLIPNGSFEIDADVDLIPDGYVLVSEAGSTNEIDTAESTDGVQSFRFTSTGVGGGSLTTTDFFPVNDIDDLAVNFDLRSTVATVRNIVRIEWYDVTQVFISNSDVYDSTANPTVFTSQNLLATPPALARFAKFRLIGIDPSVALAGSTFFDRCAVFYPAVVSGVFDNITVQNNQIITTNTNGDLELGPDGTGSVNISSVDPVNLVDDKNSLNLGTNDPANDPHLALGRSIANAWAVQPKLTGTSVGAEDLELCPHGGDVRVGPSIAGGGGVNLYLSTAIKGQTTSRGWVVRGLDTNDPATGGDQRVQMLLQNSSGQQAGDVGYGLTAEPDIHLKNLVQDGLVRLLGTNTALSERVLFTADPNGGVTLRYAGADIDRFLAQASGDVAVRSDANTDAENRRLILQHQDGTNRGIVGYTADDDLRLENVIDAGHVTIRGRTTASAARLMIDCDPDTDIEVSHPASDAVVWRTLPPANGGMQIDNQLTGGGFERVLTVDDRSTEREILPADLPITNDVVLSDIAEFVASAFLTDGQYHFRCVLFVTTALTGLTPGLRLRANLSGTVANPTGVVTEYDAAAIINTSLDPDTDLAGIALDSTVTKKIVYEGGFSSVDAAQVFSIQVAQNLTSASDTTIEAGSFFHIWKE